MSSIDSIAKFGLAGVFRNMEAANKHAHTISRSFFPGEDVGFDETVEAMIGLKQAAHGVQANAKVIKVGQELNKTLLDIA